MWKEISYLPILESDKTEVIDLDNLQPLTGGVEQQLDAVVAELDGEIVGQGLLITVRNLHSYC